MSDESALRVWQRPLEHLGVYCWARGHEFTERGGRNELFLNCSRCGKGSFRHAGDRLFIAFVVSLIVFPWIMAVRYWREFHD